MGALRNRTTAIAALLLATITFSGVLAQSHGHDSLDLSTAHGDLPAFSAGHEQPDHTVHIEGATRIEAASCVACLQQRQRATAMPEPLIGDFEPGSSAIATATAWRPAAEARRLKPARAPPRA